MRDAKRPRPATHRGSLSARPLLNRYARGPAHRLGARGRDADSNPCSNPPTTGPVRGHPPTAAHPARPAQTAVSGHRRTPIRWLTRKRSLVRSQYRPPCLRGSEAVPGSPGAAFLHPRTPTRTPTALMAGVGGRARMGCTALPWAPPPHCPRRSATRERKGPTNDDPLPVSPHGRGHRRRGRATDNGDRGPTGRRPTRPRRTVSPSQPIHHDVSG